VTEVNEVAEVIDETNIDEIIKNINKSSSSSSSSSNNIEQA
jgi:ribosomal protein L12E/L44/L45/RPP1/RPP2